MEGLCPLWPGNASGLLQKKLERFIGEREVWVFILDLLPPETWHHISCIRWKGWSVNVNSNFQTEAFTLWAVCQKGEKERDWSWEKQISAAASNICCFQEHIFSERLISRRNCKLELSSPAVCNCNNNDCVCWTNAGKMNIINTTLNTLSLCNSCNRSVELFWC